MYRYIAIVTDANIAGELMIPVESIEEAKGIIRDAGSWRHYADALAPHYASGGAVLLSEPAIKLVGIARHDTARIAAHQLVRELNEGYGLSYDALLETGPRGGVQRTF